MLPSNKRQIYKTLLYAFFSYLFEDPRIKMQGIFFLFFKLFHIVFAYPAASYGVPSLRARRSQCAQDSISEILVKNSVALVDLSAKPVIFSKHVYVCFEHQVAVGKFKFMF